MKFVHLSDLHLGKRVNDFSMIEDQRFILEKIIEIIRDETPEAVIIAGDIYDKPVPPAEAVELFDDFISELEGFEVQVFIISGNHDSAERLSFGSRIMDKRGIHFAGGYDGSIYKIPLSDEYGIVNFYMLPFLKPSHVRAAMEKALLPEESRAEIRTYTEAVKYAVESMKVNTTERNVIICHQFVTDSVRSESEEISVGGLDNVDSSVFSQFDYTALGHLHIPQETSTGRIRYCGSPLKYSFSETDQCKSVTIVELGEKKDEITYRDISLRMLEPHRDMKILKGRYSELTDKNYYSNLNTDDYFRIILTDEEDIIGALAGLRAVYPNLMRLDYDNTRTRAVSAIPDRYDNDSRTPAEIFGCLYETQNGRPMDDEQTALISELIEKIWSEDK